MNSYKKQMLSLLIMVSPAATLQAIHPLQEVINEINDAQDRIQKQITNVHEEIKKSFISSFQPAGEMTAIHIQENKNSDTVQTSIMPLSLIEKKFDASMDQQANMLTINTPVGTVVIRVEDNIINVSFNQKIIKEEDQKTGKHQTFLNSYSTASKTVSADVALEQSQIEYDQQEKRLMVTTPVRKKPLLKIPVTIKDSSTSIEHTEK